jgi:hypothetical protein
MNLLNTISIFLIVLPFISAQNVDQGLFKRQWGYVRAVRSRNARLMRMCDRLRARRRLAMRRRFC